MRARGLIRYRYGLLLGLILVSLAFQLAAPDDDWARLATVVLQGSTLLLALWTSGVGRSMLGLAALLVAFAFAGATAAVVSGGEVGTDSTVLINVVLAGVATGAVVIGVVRNAREDLGVTLSTMFGVLCVYLLLGMLFAAVYGAIDAISADGLFAQQIDADRQDFLYFSFTTLTTTGYGDLSAGSGLGRSVAIMEALLGQVYLVTVVAAIVSNLKPRRT